MAGQYDVKVQLGRQEEGLWRAEVPELTGCWVDAPTLAQALADLQGVIAMALDQYDEEGWVIPATVKPLRGEPTRATIPVIVGEHRFIRVKQRTR